MKDNKVYLLQILDFIDKIESYTQEGQDVYMNSSLIQDAVIRNFEIIGEAAKQISEDVKKDHPGIPWRKITGFRDILIHRYMGVDLDAVWNAIIQDLPPLKREILKIVSE